MSQDFHDRLRSLVLAGSCVAFVATPTLGALIGEGEQTRRYDTVITPPDYAFAVWGPIFAGCLASTVVQCLPGGRSDPVSRRAGWPLIGAYAVNTAWSLAAQRDRFELTPYLLPVATACAAVAHIRLQGTRPRTGWASATPASTGLLLGWTALASTVNIAAGAVAAGTDRTAPRTVTASAIGLLAASAAVAAGVAVSRRGGTTLALASAWGLLTTAATRGRPRSIRLAAAAGATAIAAARSFAARTRP
ncbi:hypothetical protein Ait01nite_099840 [Actinoplanes italicus]|uniref:TspO/MBR related protein n=1 Tax=Actinoplanes italicus TaxID=113567 RepID=A0A2T0KGG2_9ACTN|nr:hypothetical protein [Actinoplanes italicus]PRX22525.1 hypothetical protein CLV67_10452 [Actinoplanes italicus]GIE36939.1 hypothetical protein Ait01nite_099840 [Actinoplanes italicus]